MCYLIFYQLDLRTICTSCELCNSFGTEQLVSFKLNLSLGFLWYVGWCNDLVLLSWLISTLCAYRHFSQNSFIQIFTAFMKSELYKSPEDKSQWHVDRLCRSKAISSKHINDPHESYVAVLVLGYLWHEMICTKSIVSQCSVLLFSCRRNLHLSL